MCSCGSVSADRTLPVFWGGSRPPYPPGWGAAAPKIPRGRLDPNGGRPLEDPPGVISTSSKTIWPARCAITWAASGCDYGQALAGIHDLFKARGALRDPGEALPTECTIEQKHSRGTYPLKGRYVWQLDCLEIKPTGRFDPK